MIHRDPDDEALARWVRRSRSRPYEIVVLLILVVLVVSVGLHRRLGQDAAPAPTRIVWPGR